MKKLFTLIGALTIFLNTQAQTVKMMIGDNNNGQIVTANLTGGDLDTITTSNFSYYDADVDEINKKVYTAWYYGIYSMNFDGSAIDTIMNYPTGGYSAGVVVDERNGKVYWTSQQEDLILSADLDGSNMDTLLELPSSFYLTDIDIDTINNHFYFSSWITSGKGVFRCNLNGSGLDTVILGMDVQFLGLNVTQNQILYSNNSEVRRINFDSTGDTLMFSFQPGGMIFNETNNLWYISDMTNAQIVTCDSDGNNFNTYLSGNLASPHGPVFITYTATPVIEQSQLDFKLYPNPTNGNITIQFEKTKDQVNVVLYSITGQMIESRKFLNTLVVQLEIDQPAGIYILEVTETGGEKATLRFIKE